MTDNFTTSVNILRDTERDFNYIPTPNASRIVNQIVNDFKKGIRSFNIIGTYGTGKSSFLWAFEQSLEGKKRYFEPNFIVNPKIDIIKIVGSYTSIIDEFADIFKVATNKNKHENILSEIFNHYHSNGKDNGILFLLIDEFGKFLEYASKNSPEKELYFIQELAEFCNNPTYNIVLITTVHQSFESYAYSLNSIQKQEWTKVKGRFREITFNEPVEQLLYLASEYVEENISLKPNKSTVEKCLKLAVETKAFNFNEDFLNEIALKLFPLDILAANTLTLALQRYGQNERSLFSFLESTDHTGLTRFNNKEIPFYNLSCVYDYLNFNFYSFLTSRYNPDFSVWSSIRSAIENVERTFDTSINDYIKIIKTIGMLSVFSANGAVLDGYFLNNYLKIACGISNSETLIKNLETKKIIRFRSYSKRYILFEGTDLDIQTAIIEAGNKISEVSDVASLLNKHIQLPPKSARQYSFITGTPRTFLYKISDYPINDIPENETDGYINIVVNDRLKERDIQNKSEQQDEAIIYCFFKNSTEIKDLLFEIEKSEKVLQENKEDRVAKRELEIIMQSQVSLLENQIKKKGLFTENVVWFFNGKEKNVTNETDFNKLLSQVCSNVYNATPVFKNELVNRHKISPSIHTARKNYFRALVNNWDKENLGFKSEKFPPEKTIYLSLLKENNISPIRDNATEVLTISENSSFYRLWVVSENFIEDAKFEPKRISDFIEILNKRPFKLKQGLIDFWVPTFLFLKRDDFAVFNEDSYIPHLSEENLELITKKPQDYTIKAFDVEGVKLDVFNSYRTFLNQSAEQKFENNSFIETIKPFIIFYKQLPEYSKQTKRLSPTALKIREAIVKSKDPEETFFESFPNALGFSLNTLQQDNSKLQNYTIHLQNAVRELRTSYDGLVKRFEDFICDEIVGRTIDFEEYKEYLQNRYKNLKKHLLLANQKTFVRRIDSAIEDKTAWLNSIAQVITGKTLEVFTDEDEIMLYEKFKAMILELDSLTSISKIDIDEANEEVVGVKIDSFFSKIDPKIVRVPKSKSPEIEELKIMLKANLGNDKTSNIAAVLNLLKELME